MSKGLKIGLGIGAVLLLIVILYFVFRKKAATFTANPDKDIRGFDLSNESPVTLEQAKTNAAKMGALAFTYYPADQRAWYKSAAGPLETAWNPGATVYVKS